MPFTQHSGALAGKGVAEGGEGCGGGIDGVTGFGDGQFGK